MEGPDKVVRGCFRSTVRRVGLILQVLRKELLAISQMVLPAAGLRRKRRLDPLRMRHLQRPIHLIRADMVETARDAGASDNRLASLDPTVRFAPGPPSYGAEGGTGCWRHRHPCIHLPSHRHPIRFGSLQKRQRTHHIGLSKGKGILDGTIHMTLCGQVDNPVHLLLLHEFQHPLKIADIHLDKAVIRLVLDIFQVGKIPGIG